MSPVSEQLSLTDIPAPPKFAPLPEQEISGEVLIEKYAKGKETNVHDVRRRVAYALAQVEQEKDRAHWEARFLWAQENGFIPAGRINSAAGTDLAGDADQLFRAAGRRLHRRDHRRQARHLHRAGPGRRNHAPRRRRRLRLLLASVRRAPTSRARSRALPARCPTCASSTVRARPSNRPAPAAARRWACCAATIRISRSSSTPRTRAT